MKRLSRRAAWAASGARAALFVLIALGASCLPPRNVVRQEAATPASTPPEEEAPVMHRGPKKRVGVVAFENHAQLGGPQLGEAAADILTTHLQKSGAFIIFDRRNMADVIHEHEIGMSGLADPATVLQMGLIKVLSAIVVGSIQEYAETTEDRAMLVAIQRIQRARVVVNVRVIDTTTGQVLLAEEGAGVAEKVFSQAMVMQTPTGTMGTATGLGDEALRQAIVKVVGTVITHLERTEWSGAVAKVLGKTVYINAGQRTGLLTGASLTVRSVGEIVADPQTGMPIGRAPGVVKARIEVVGFFGDDGSICEVKSGSGVEVGDEVRLDEVQAPPDDPTSTTPPAVGTGG
jgi:curli biogenesis system outer membrane secretion channel CsgG